MSRGCKILMKKETEENGIKQILEAVFIERAWNYFENDYDYFIVLLKDNQRFERKISREEGKELWEVIK
jgi:hypothetical protein